MDRRTLEKRYDEVMGQMHHYRSRCQDLEQELRICRPELYRSDQKIDRLQQRNVKLADENKTLKQKLADLTEQLKQKPKPSAPAFVKANRPDKRPKKPGRKKGHPAALRPMPVNIDVHETVAFPVDNAGKASCPQCKTQLSDVQHHDRLVEDIIPSKVITTCYHTISGYCPSCRRQMESRGQNQPPAADLPHAQLGLNTLATAAVMRVCYRLPFRQITRLFLQLPGLKLSPGGIVKQLKRLAGWLEKQYHRLKLALRVAGVVYADETGWRTNGKNGYLWTLTNTDHTLYHIDRSRSGKVLIELLGKSFGKTGQAALKTGQASPGTDRSSGFLDQTLVSDFYSVYDQLDGPQQKCLTHLLRELRDTIARRAELKEHAFFKRCKRLVKDMLRLKAKQEQLTPRIYAHRVQLVENRLELLSPLKWNDADADRLGGRLKKYRSKLTTFLHKKHVEGTNNRAERAIRPAVVMRKITGGSRSAEGARSWAILASVIRTAEQQGHEVLGAIKALLRAEWSGQQIALLTNTS
jgi:transposase